MNRPPDQPRWPRGTPGGGHRPGAGPGRWRPKQGDWADRLSDRLAPDDVELNQADRVLPEGWAQRLAELGPDEVDRRVRRGDPWPVAAPEGPTGSVELVTAETLMERLAAGQQGWQYFYQRDDEDPEGIWVDVGRAKRHTATPDRAWLYRPDGQYLDTRNLASGLWVRRRVSDDPSPTT